MVRRKADDPDAVREPIAVQLASWAALAASFWMSVETWVGMARLGGFGDSAPALPVGIDGLTIVALVTWTIHPDPKVQHFARRVTYALATFSILAQSTYHGVKAASGDPWLVLLAVVVGMIPPLCAALAVHFRALVRQAAADRVARRRQASADALATAAGQLDAATQRALAMAADADARLRQLASLADASAEAARRDADELAERLATDLAGARQEAASVAEELARQLASARRQASPAAAAGKPRQTVRPAPASGASYVDRYPEVARRLAAGESWRVVAEEEGVSGRTVQRVAADLAKAGAEVVAAASAAAGEGGQR